MKALCNANIDVLKQLQDLIAHTSQAYGKDPASPHAGISQHVRHVLDHYRAFTMGLQTGVVDYNLRQRQCLEETQPEAALATTGQLISFFESNLLSNFSFTVISEISLHVEHSTTMDSTTERELLYLINHSIHHMAYASLLASTQGVTVPRHIGLAPGTATYERQQELKHA